MTERDAGALQRDRTSLAIGPSALSWNGQSLTIDIDEITVPWPSRLRGRLVLHPSALSAASFDLDAHGMHRWTPIAPCSRVEVMLEHPALRWSGNAYLDANAGDGPLEDSFSGWEWSRTTVGNRTAVLYDTRRSDGSTLAFGKCFDANGRIDDLVLPGKVALPPSGWRVARSTFCENAGHASVVRTLEDGPFYTRSLISSQLLNEPPIGEPQLAIHESLSLDRFRKPWVQLMLPFRMPRIGS